jgi:hypothetical protein
MIVVRSTDSQSHRGKDWTSLFVTEVPLSPRHSYTSFRLPPTAYEMEPLIEQDHCSLWEALMKCPPGYVY